MHEKRSMSPITFDAEGCGRELQVDLAFVLDLKLALCALFERHTKDIGKTGDLSADADLARELVDLKEFLDELDAFQEEEF